MIDVQKILDLQSRNVADWHKNVELSETELPWKHIEENNMWNFSLWHEEDIARIKDIDPLRIVEAKRNIDKYNQSRNNAMEKIDEWILSYLDSRNIRPGDKIHSETPGMMIDRLSIMTLKKYHMQEEVDRPDASEEHKVKCADKVKVLSEQMDDLASSLKGLFSDIGDSKLRFKVYRQFKMYNDPSLNPELYKRAQKE
jgi:hypothetical protein